MVVEVVLDADTAITAFDKLHRGRYGFLLESLEGGERWARYSFLATEPRTVFHYLGDQVQRLDDDGEFQHETTATPLNHLAELLRDTTAPEVPGLPRFTGGAVGFWGYDVVRTLESLPGAPGDNGDIPDAVVMMVDTLLVIDHLFHRAIVIANVKLDRDLTDEELDRRILATESRANDWLDRLNATGRLGPLVRPANPATVETTSEYHAADYQRDVAICQEHIAAGDAFQIVLSRRLNVTQRADPFLTYRWLRSLNPAPYCYFLRLGELTLVGASPEVLARVENNRVTVRPIAGTRPRGKDADEDAEHEASLRADPKEVAEHRMLVDLGRNDVGRVSKFGSVTVVQQMVVERYSHVMHLVSEVQGDLRPELDALDALAAAFPAGTLTGAPKVRAMEIIDTLEKTRRGPYGGAVGYVGYGARTMDTAIAIRTVVFNQEQASVQAGAGVVADSVPLKEFEETLAKARAPLQALGLALATQSGAPNR